MGQKKLCSAKSNPNNTSNLCNTSNPALTFKNVIFFRVLLFAVIHSTAPLAGSLLTSTLKQIGLLLGAKGSSLQKKSPGLGF